MKIKFIAVAVTLFFLLPGSSCFGETADKYFPLKEGMAWVYGVLSNKPGTQKITITNLAPREVKGKSVTPRKWEVGGGVKYNFVAQDDFGVYQYAEQTGENGEPKVISPKLYDLRNPVDRGTTWDLVIKTGEEDLKVNATIESISETVQVPAGTYKDCVKVKQEGGGLVKKGGDTKLSITAYEWFAPGVGTVKSMFTFKRNAPGKPESTETTTYQLESFKP